MRKTRPDVRRHAAIASALLKELDMFHITEDFKIEAADRLATVAARAAGLFDRRAKIGTLPRRAFTGAP